MPKVRATRVCFYAGCRRRVGEVFYISDKQREDGQYAEFSAGSMVIVEDDAQVGRGVSPQRAGPRVITSDAPAKGPAAPTPQAVVSGAEADKPASGDGGDGGDEAIVAALSRLDHGDDTHWTSAGLPSTEAVGAFVGERVKRVDIDRVDPNLRRRV